MDYLGYTPEALAADDSFVRWVLLPDDETEAFWRQWVLRHPGSEELIREARELVMLASDAGEMPTEEQIQRLRRGVYQRIRRPEPTPIPLPKPTLFRTVWWRVAAVLAFILLSAGAVFLFTQRLGRHSYHTDYGQTRTLSLPDGSRVVLNANSTLRYTNQWDARAPREVWLDGEAFFSITHQQNNQPFIVHTRRVAVEVLGTSFNVWQRNDRAKVVLCTGKIRLRTTQSAQVEMKPGQMAVITGEQSPLIRRVADTTAYTAWKENKLVFDHLPLKDVATLIQEQYGRQVVIRDSSLLRQELTLKLPDDDLDLLLTSIEKLFRVRSVRSEDTIILEKKTSP